MFIKTGTYRAEDGTVQRLKLRDPTTKQFLPDEGMEVPDTDLFYRQCLQTGDVVLADPPAEQPALPLGAPSVNHEAE